MATSRSKLTKQGRTSIPSSIREKLGIEPGSVLEWEEMGDQVVVRRAGRFSSEEIHQALFRSRKPDTKSAAELKAGIRIYARKRDTRG